MNDCLEIKIILIVSINTASQSFHESIGFHEGNRIVCYTKCFRLVIWFLRGFESICQTHKSIFSVPHRQKTPSFRMVFFGGDEERESRKTKSRISVGEPLRPVPTLVDPLVRAADANDSPRLRKYRSSRNGVFSVIPPLRVGEIAFGGEIALRAVKSASPAGGWISFHFAAQLQNFTFVVGQTFHVEKAKHFTKMPRKSEALV